MNSEMLINSYTRFGLGTKLIFTEYEKIIYIVYFGLKLVPENYVHQMKEN
jgi:hypothetical protein